MDSTSEASRNVIEQQAGHVQQSSYREAAMAAFRVGNWVRATISGICFGFRQLRRTPQPYPIREIDLSSCSYDLARERHGALNFIDRFLGRWRAAQQVSIERRLCEMRRVQATNALSS